MGKICPHCKSELPEESSFCPHCARSLVHPRPLRLPWHISLRFLAAVLILVLAAGAAVILHIQNLPKTYEGLGELTYTDSHGSYQLLLSTSQSDRYSPQPIFEASAGGEDSYRIPCCLYVNHKDTGADASEEFREKLASVQVQIDQPDGISSPILCSEPVPMDFNQDVLLVSLIDYTRDSFSPARICWVLSMKNGDTLQLEMELVINVTHIYDYDSTNCDLASSQALQALIDRLAEETSPDDTVNLYLPPITYEDPVVIHTRSFNLIGSQSDEGRTTFVSGIQMRDNLYWISYISNMDFIGDGTGVAISAAGRLWTQNCRFENWKTALLGFGQVWINTTDCTFENNETGLYYNSSGVSASDSRFTGNLFRNNGTAVLLEQVPTDIILDFGQCVFENNQTDIDNRCGQPLSVE